MKITRGSSSLSTTVYLTNHANEDPDVFWPWAEQYVKIYLIEHRRIPVKAEVLLSHKNVIILNFKCRLVNLIVLSVKYQIPNLIRTK